MPELISVPPAKSHLTGIFYTTETRVLRIAFKGGSSYEYLDVPIEKFEGFQLADSPGTYLNAEIKGKFEFRKIDAPPAWPTASPFLEAHGSL